MLSREAENEFWYNLVHNTNRDDAQRLLTAIDEGRVIGDTYWDRHRRPACGCVYGHLHGIPKDDDFLRDCVDQLRNRFELAKFAEFSIWTPFEMDLLHAFVDSEDEWEPFLAAVREVVYDVYPELRPVVEVVE